MVRTHNLGFPRIGAQRELKKATEAYWKGKIGANDLLETGKELRKRHWTIQREAGIDLIPVNDFSFYDQTLDLCALVGAVPPRFGFKGGQVDLDTYFAMARGVQEKNLELEGGKQTITAMEMTKWFDTNYHYIVPEFHKDQKFSLSSSKLFDEFEEAKAMGLKGKPVLVGPVSFLLLGKAKDEGVEPLGLLDSLLPVYIEALKKLQAAGAEWVQLDEPHLALDLPKAAAEAYKKAYDRIAKEVPGLKVLVATYFCGLRDNTALAAGLPAAGLHIDLVREPAQLQPVLAANLGDKVLSLGVLNGRNIWKEDLGKALDKIEEAMAKLGRERVMVAPSCSLLHTPIDLDQEEALGSELKSWMAFAKQKLHDIATLGKAANEGRDAVKDELAANGAALAARRNSPATNDAAVQKRAASVTPQDHERDNEFAARRPAQQAHLKLPLLPTTTIGSFPQTQEIRKVRRQFKTERISEAEYREFMENEIRDVVKRQEEIGLDVLVHGEPERNDMVEYFGEQMKGYCFTEHGWVQSFGTRYVKPPIIYGDVSRPEPMTVEWAKFAQSLTDKPMKGMLTGPVTMLCWSFVRDDQPRSETCKQLGLAIRDEVVDLESAGIKVIQIDEPAIREGLPLRRDDWGGYLRWSVDCFRLCSAGVRDETQIHTHMCYSEFNDMIESIGAMDADVISIEASRSDLELLDAFVDYQYPNEIGPGVYDIHSPRVPGVQEIVEKLEAFATRLSIEQLWVNPDCGLKTRAWPETTASLKNMVDAARQMREKVGAPA